MYQNYPELLQTLVLQLAGIKRLSSAYYLEYMESASEVVNEALEVARRAVRDKKKLEEENSRLAERVQTLEILRAAAPNSRPSTSKPVAAVRATPQPQQQQTPKTPPPQNSTVPADASSSKSASKKRTSSVLDE